MGAEAKYECSKVGELVMRSGEGTYDAIDKQCLYTKTVVKDCGQKDLCNASTKSCSDPAGNVQAPPCTDLNGSPTVMGEQWGCYANCVDQSNPDSPIIKWGTACVAKVYGGGNESGKCGDYAACYTTD